ncbi:hypothetical protein [Sphingomonas koreensis]
MGQDEFTAAASLDEHGRQLDARWHWYTRGAVLSFGHEGNARGELKPRERDGSFMIGWQRTAPLGTPSQTFHLNLTSDPEWGGWFPEVPFASVTQGDGASLRVSWPDTLAFARGADKLFIVVRDGKGQILDKHDFPRDILARTSAAVTAGLEKLEAKKSEYRTQCYFMEDSLEVVIN